MGPVLLSTLQGRPASPAAGLLGLDYGQQGFRSHCWRRQLVLLNPESAVRAWTSRSPGPASSFLTSPVRVLKFDNVHRGLHVMIDVLDAVS